MAAVTKPTAATAAFSEVAPGRGAAAAPGRAAAAAPGREAAGEPEREAVGEAVKEAASRLRPEALVLAGSACCRLLSSSLRKWRSGPTWPSSHSKH